MTSTTCCTVILAAAAAAAAADCTTSTTSSKQLLHSNELQVRVPCHQTASIVQQNRVAGSSRSQPAMPMYAPTDQSAMQGEVSCCSSCSGSAAADCGAGGVVLKKWLMRVCLCEQHYALQPSNPAR
jgi:hypothetical protein